MSHDEVLYSRREALRCVAYGGAGTLFTLAGGVFTPIDLAMAQACHERQAGKSLGRPLFVQISDTHIGFSKEANPDVAGTLARTIDIVNGLPEQPALLIHTGDITHLSKPAEFDLAQQLLGRLRVSEMHTVPGEHDTADAAVRQYFDRFGKASNNKGYYSFDHSGVHFIALINVLQFKPGGLGTLGEEQLAWVASDLKHRSSSTPIVVFAHMPLWTIYEPWGWGTGDADRLFDSLRRFGSVTVLNGHIHQIVQKVEGHMTFHTARSTSYPQPLAGDGAGPGPLTVAMDRLPEMLGITSVSVGKHPGSVQLEDTTLALRGSTAQADPTAKIVISGFMFAPAQLRVKAGTRVTWTNADEEPHTVISATGLFKSGGLDTNERFSFRFDKPGVYPFACSIHPRMVGTVIVE